MNIHKVHYSIKKLVNRDPYYLKGVWYAFLLNIFLYYLTSSR